MQTSKNILVKAFLEKSETARRIFDGSVAFFEQTKKFREMNVEISPVILLGFMNTGKTSFVEEIAKTAKVDIRTVNEMDENYKKVLEKLEQENFRGIILFKIEKSEDINLKELEKSLKREIKGYAGDILIFLELTKNNNKLNDYNILKFPSEIDVDTRISFLKSILKQYVYKDFDFKKFERNSIRNLTPNHIINISNICKIKLISEGKEFLNYEEVFKIMVDYFISKSEFPKNKAQSFVAIHEAAHALTVYKLSKIATVSYITNIPSDEGRGCCYSKIIGSDISDKDFRTSIKICLSGYVAEIGILGINYSGRAIDLNNAMYLAERMVFGEGLYPIGKYSTLISVKDQKEICKLPKYLQDKGYKKVYKILAECEKETIEFCGKNKDLIIKLAKRIEEKNYMTADEFADFCKEERI